MIRRSGIVAAIAVLLSLVLHLLLGIGFTWPSQPQPGPSGGETTTELVAPGTAFEDLADTASEPEPTPAAPVEAEPVPEPTDVLTSQALIASDTPQQGTTPDTGTTQAVEPETTGPSAPQSGDTPEPDTVDPIGADETEATDPILTPPAGTDTVTDIPLGEPNAPTEPLEAPTQPLAVSPPTTTAPAAAAPIPPVAVAPVAPSVPVVSLEPSEITPKTPDVAAPAEPPADPSEAPTQPLAVSPPTTTTPAATAPIPPVAVAPVAPSVPVVSLEPAEIEPETPDIATPAEPEPIGDPVETANTVEPVENDASETAVTTSLRPQLPTQRPAPKPTGLSTGSSQTTTARRAPAPRIESPLTAFKRDGTSTIGRRSNGSRSGGTGLRNSFSGGNSGVTNYAGRVLSQLNRTSPVAVTGNGWARVFFLINPNGTLASVSVVDSSGSSSINRAAQQQVRSAGRFPRTPDGKSRRLSFFYRIR
ncbi:TonB family protein [Tateyamaria sp.]|uniref:TonB family protein n=1 Tax=Tateyamaria sp. TaxID=1929288 RepID=UPI00329E4C6A